MRFSIQSSRQLLLAGAASLTLLVALTGTAIASGSHAGEHQKSAAGVLGLATAVSRTIKIDGDDSMRFTPESVSVKRGETVRFVVTDSGQLPHEFVIATASEQREHQQMMQSMPNMEHAEANALSLQPGETKTLIWKFTQPGNIQFACHEPGHYAAGMKGTVKVVSAAVSQPVGGSAQL